jgi:hypothetical protein
VKKTELIELPDNYIYEDDDEEFPIFPSVVHSQDSPFIQDIMETIGNDVIDKNIQTFDAFFQNLSNVTDQRKTNAFDKLMSYKRIIVDEYAMSDYKNHIGKLYENYRRATSTGLTFPEIYMFGDPNQCRILSGNHQYDYEKTAPVLEMSKGLHISLCYKEGAARYDVGLRNFLEEFKRTRQIPVNILKPINDSFETNISYFRHGGAKTLEKVNKQHFKGFKKGVPVICTETYRCEKYSLFHNQLFIIDEYDLENDIVKLHLRDDESKQIDVKMVFFFYLISALPQEIDWLKCTA